MIECERVLYDTQVFYRCLSCTQRSLIVVCCYIQTDDSQAVKAFCDRAKNLENEMNKFVHAAPSTLKEYSGWLSSFQACHYDDLLEIPGAPVEYSFVASCTLLDSISCAVLLHCSYKVCFNAVMLLTGRQNDSQRPITNLVHWSLKVLVCQTSCYSWSS